MQLHRSATREPVRIALLVAFATCVAACPGRAGTDASTPDAIDSSSIDVTTPLDASDTLDAHEGSLPDDAGPPIRVLFIGNSYTYVNDLPAMVRALSRATPGPALDVDSVTLGGATLAMHWDSTGARERVAAGGWNAVVLQGQSTEPLTSADDFTFAAQLFAEATRNVAARTVWYATWARRAGDPFYAATGLDPASMTAGLDGAYRSVAQQYGGFVARVGAAWALAATELPTVNLYADDGSHPSPAGTLLAACVMFQALAQRAARVPDPAPLGVPHDVALALCDLAPRVECIEMSSRCGDACVRLDRDPANCGACGATCSAPRSCAAGSCRCPGAVFASPSFAELAAIEPSCDPSTDASAPACAFAMHRYCAMRECADSGYIQMPMTDNVFGTCLSADIQDTTYSALHALVPACDGTTVRAGAACSLAAHRYCVSHGAPGGYGPVEANGDMVRVACARSEHATVVHTNFDRLAQIRPACNGIGLRWGGDCAFASFAVCRSGSHTSGFGPIEVSDRDVDVICVDP